jgi:hypothetical protein
LGRFTTAAEIAGAIRLVAGAIQKVTQFGG